MRWLWALIAVVVLVALGAFFWPTLHRTIVASHVGEAPAPAPTGQATPPPASVAQTSPFAPPSAAVAQSSPPATAPAPRLTDVAVRARAPADACSGADCSDCSICAVSRARRSGTHARVRRRDDGRGGGCDTRLRRQGRKRTRVSQTGIRRRGPRLGAQSSEVHFRHGQRGSSG